MQSSEHRVMPSARCWLLAALFLSFVVVPPCPAEVDPAWRTAELPDSWLVVYNADSPDSVTWAQWYCDQWGIPAQNALGLPLSTDAERVPQACFYDGIRDAVRAYLAANPDVEARVMGILVGYRVPGNFYQDATHPALPGGGGWSVSNHLQDLTATTWHQRFNIYHFVARLAPNEQRLTKTTLAPGFYLTARIDAPTLADAQALTLRARAIRRAHWPLPADEHLYCDDVDVGAPGGDVWTALQDVVGDAAFNDPPDRFPWFEYESETEPTPYCALLFSYYRLTGWNAVDWGGTPLGTRILGYALNSYGATTVRSTTDHNGRFVPNALVGGLFAAAIGATAEPFLNHQPDPSTLVWCLADGRTVAEAFFHANPYHNFMWELVGDPLLRVPLWFGDTADGVVFPDQPEPLAALVDPLALQRQ